MTFSAKDSFKTFAARKAKRLLVPYFCLGIPLVISSFVTRWADGVEDIGEYLSVIIRFLLQRRMYTIWFLTALFVMSLMLYFVVRAFKKNGQIAVVSLLIGIVGILYVKLVGVRLIWNIDVAFSAFPFMAAGYLFKNKIECKAEKIDKIFRLWYCIPAALLYAAGVFVNYRISGEKLDLAIDSYGIVPITYLCAFLGMYCAIYVAIKISRFDKVLSYLGQNTYVYFAWHQSIVLPLLLYLYKVLGVFQADNLISDAVRTLVTVVLIFLILYPIDRLMSRSRLKFCLGK